MLPGNVLSTKYMKARFLYPDSLVRRTELEDYEMGGVALQDPSQGLLVKPWHGMIDPVTRVATLVPLNTAETPTVIFTETVDPVEFSFAFDLNMRHMSAVRFADNTCKLRWYDSAIPGYTTTTYTGIQSMMLAMDDKRQVASSGADVLLSYITTDGRLCVRNQRDRFLVEYVLSTGINSQMRITNFGMSRNNRVQWRIGVRTFI